MQHTRRVDDRTDPCQIAGCIYSALYTIARPIQGANKTLLHSTIRVCRRCAAELTALHDWKLQ